MLKTSGDLITIYDNEAIDRFSHIAADLLLQTQLGGGERRVKQNRKHSGGFFRPAKPRELRAEKYVFANPSSRSSSWTPTPRPYADGSNVVPPSWGLNVGESTQDSSFGPIGTTSFPERAEAKAINRNSNDGASSCGGWNLLVPPRSSLSFPSWLTRLP
ncbi:family 1 extracellular solute-binding protein [Anopheles sinensis]|uniref:Family 1 extracellular solute-binding protein n=1 Tax=Anopheles sinensis TaxID=74873 RepID=A0A084WL76_ANOSI|nr:family 1 extracellular solute-binding protein [Anopheles sinensis]